MCDPEPEAPSQSPRSRPARILVGALAGALAVLAFAGLLGLGSWQLERRAWKLDLIARVTERLRVEPVPTPPRPDWPGVTADDTYRRVRATGTFLNERETLVQAVTEFGAGFWVLTPLALRDGDVVMVNRGFVPTERRDPAFRSAGWITGETTIVGLLRLSEPGGAFLRANDPTAGRWYSRDIAAIAAARGLGNAAPYFIDADATPVPGGLPVGGLTVIAFRNDHLVYALTWYALALMLAGAGIYLIHDARRSRRRNPGQG
ncbi:SURF1 family protein [Methylobacterium planeticum]|uniref:SURF1-like protein n=1 Tax=Methylobacterium planeticum TaxID=2615211 RepID=A0A6N6MQL2_9HYPH|nr:SURF1 family protein [Methylobacterium planeticum]KAB1072390.1 SURF1 family protein [Methylobacterium planeticum]